MTEIQTIYEFADTMKVNHYTVRMWINEGLIPYLRVKGVIRIEPEEAVKALRNYKAEAAAKEPVTA